MNNEIKRMDLVTCSDGEVGIALGWTGRNHMYIYRLKDKKFTTEASGEFKLLMSKEIFDSQTFWPAEVQLSPDRPVS